MFCRPFVLFLLVIVLSILLRYTDYDYPFGIFKLFLYIARMTDSQILYIYLSFVGAYWIFSGVVVVGMIFLFFTLPETKDKQLEEVETLFETPWCVCGKSGSFEINLSSIKQM